MDGIFPPLSSFFVEDYYLLLRQDKIPHEIYYA